MVVGAVLPPSTGWGFEFTPTKNRINSSASSSPSTSAQKQSWRKRKGSSPDRMDSGSDDETNANGESFNAGFNQALVASTTPATQLPVQSQTPFRQFASPGFRVGKRARVPRTGGRKLAITRVLETLDKKGLENLVVALCEQQPELADQVSALLPPVTPRCALENLAKYLTVVFQNMPYSKHDERGDYAYFRVRSPIEEFLRVLNDYTGHFLPPNEQQPTNTLAFLDGATELMHKLPVWTNAVNNHNRNLAYEELNSAWILAIKEAAKKANGLPLAHGGWEHKLEKHNQAEGNGILLGALECVRQELAWLGNGSSPVPKDAYFYDLRRSGFSAESVPKTTTILE